MLQSRFVVFNETITFIYINLFLFKNSTTAAGLDLWLSSKGRGFDFRARITTFRNYHVRLWKANYLSFT